ncbi:MAG: PTS sugar transporter subunit IIC [Brevinema sp.]
MEKIMMWLQKFASQRHLQAVKDGMILAITPTLVGSFFLIIRFFPNPAYLEFMSSSPIGTWLLYPLAGTLDMLSIIAILGISYRLTEGYKIEPLGAQVTAIMSFMVITPFKILVSIPERAEALSVDGIPVILMGARGLFVAIFVTLLTVEIYCRLTKKGFIIKMPDSVPPAVSKSFSAVIPSMVAITLVLLIRIFFEYTSFKDAHNFITTIIATPLKASLNSVWGAMFYSFLYNFCWSFGIHGDIISPIYSPIWIELREANRVAFQSGLTLPSVLTYEFNYSMAYIGGTGSTLVFVIMSIFWAKSKHLRSIGKLALGPAIFQINEPVIFGVPIVLNPVMMIPFIFTGPILTGLAYTWVSLGWMSAPTGIVLPWTMPTFLNVFFLTNGDWRSVVFQTINLIIAALIYYPFFRILDNSYYKAE